MLLDLNINKGSDIKNFSEINQNPENNESKKEVLDTPENEQSLEKVLERHAGIREDILKKAEEIQISAAQDALKDKEIISGEQKTPDQTYSHSLQARNLEYLLNHSNEMINDPAKAQEMQEDANEIKEDSEMQA